MNIFLWNSYEEGEINNKIKYWVDLWEDLIENFDNDSYGLNLVNPNLLLMDIIDEIRFNRLKNSRNRKKFIIEMRKMLKSDPIIKNFFKSDFTLIIKELESKRPPEYLLQLCEDISELFSEELYFNQSCDFLKDILINSNWNQDDEENIYLISQNLMVEFILIGYGLNTIKNLPSNLFDKYTTIVAEDGELLITKFPLNLNSEDFQDGEDFNKNDYNEALKKEIKSLSISDRIERLKFYYDEQPSEGYAILKVEGLKGNVDLKIGNVNFYKPKIENYVDKTETNDFNVNKLKYFVNENSYSFINAAVKIKYRNLESAKLLAVESIDKSLDILRCHIHSEVPFKIDSDNLIIVDENGKKVGDSYDSKNMPHIKEINSFNLEKFKESFSDDGDYFTNIEQMLSDSKTKKSFLADKLIYSLHWYRKAFESNNLEDKLLNYWIVIENLVTFDSQIGNLVLPSNKNENKFSLVEELVPPIELIDFIGRISIDLYYYLQKLTNSSQSNSEATRHLLELPKENIEACFLQPHIDVIKVDMKEFIKNIPPLINLVPNKIIKDKIAFADKFYSDNDFAYQEIIERLDQTKHDLLLIYRYRNLIVHNARFDSTILPYYIKKAERFAGNILRTILSEFVMDNTKTHEKILLSKKVKIQRMLDKLKNNDSLDLWDF